MHSKQHSRGFSLIELLVSISILVAISTLILVNQNRFGGTISLSNLAYQVALTIRQAQTYGFSVREAQEGTGNFTPSFGVHFASNSPYTYILFADKNGSGRYENYDNDGNQIPDENFAYFVISGNKSISSFCGIFANGSQKCNPTITSLDILFKRPDPDAIIKSDIVADTYSSARITLKAGEGLTRGITVVSTGQIGVDPTSSTTNGIGY